MREWEREGKRVCAVNFTLEREALEILRRHTPNPRGYGHFLSRLLYEYRARQEERERIQKQLAEVVGVNHAA
jgi:hypothetical protein